MVPSAIRLHIIRAQSLETLVGIKIHAPSRNISEECRPKSLEQTFVSLILYYKGNLTAVGIIRVFRVLSPTLEHFYWHITEVSNAKYNEVETMIYLQTRKGTCDET